MSNHIEITGNTSRDGAELRFTPNGAAVCNFRVAATESRWDKAQNARVDDGEPLWLGVQAWSGLAEQVAEQIGTGQSRYVTVTGHLKRRSYTTQDGQERTVDEVVARSVCVHPPRQDRQAPASQPQSGWGQQQTQPAQQPADPWNADTGSGGWGGQQQPSYDAPPF